MPFELLRRGLELRTGVGLELRPERLGTPLGDLDPPPVPLGGHPTDPARSRHRQQPAHAVGVVDRSPHDDRPAQ